MLAGRSPGAFRSLDALELALLLVGDADFGVLSTGSAAMQNNPLSLQRKR